MIQQDFSALRFTDDFVFCHVLIENPDLCRQIAELATGRKIKEIVNVQEQKSIKESVDGKGVRFDVVFEDEEETIYDIEMQQSDGQNLPKRTRYYQSMVDLETLRTGAKYNEIKDGYIIFICTFDPFKKGLHKYVARTVVENDPDINFNDGFTKIFLNSEYRENMDKFKTGIREFLDYIRLGLISTPLTQSIETARQRILDNDERREEFMTLLEHYDIFREEGRAEGRAEGREEGRTEGRAEMEQENITSAIREGLPKETIMKVFKISAEKYAKYHSMI